MRLYGIDFTCAPRRAKPITVAGGFLKSNSLLRVETLELMETFAQFEALLERPGPWVGGFDFPFALPRELLHDLGWPKQWKKSVALCASFPRAQFRKILDEYRASRRPGAKYAHRVTDYPAGSSSPMKLVNPPVALMFQEGAPRLLAAGVHLPALAEGDRSRVALEAYPGLLVRKQLGLRDSYKSDARREQTSARRAVRRTILKRLSSRQENPLGIALRLAPGLEKTLIEDGSGDRLDAVICAVQAAWAASRPRFGLPPQAFAGEGWIVSA